MDDRKFEFGEVQEFLIQEITGSSDPKLVLWRQYRSYEQIDLSRIPLGRLGVLVREELAGPGVAVSNDQLQSAVWGEGQQRDETLIAQHIKTIRKKLGTQYPRAGDEKKSYVLGTPVYQVHARSEAPPPR